eukprot:317977_1
MSEFVDLLNSKKHKLSPFRIEQLNESHRAEALNIICYQFSCNGNCVLDNILMSTIIDQASFRFQQLDYAIKKGFALVVKDKNNKIAYLGYAFDFCDMPTLNQEKLTQIAQKRLSISNGALNSDKHRSKLIKNNIKYGEIIDFSVGVTRPDMVRLGIENAIFIAVHAIFLCMGYKYFIQEAINPITAKMHSNHMKRLGYKWYLSHSIFDYTDWIKNELNDLKYKHKYPTQKIRYLANNAKIEVFIDNYQLVRNENKLNGLKQWMRFVVNIFSTSHKL